MTTKKSASSEALEKLHAELARVMSDRLRSGEATASDLGVIRQFLKDNGIDATPRADNPLGQLVNSLPFADPDKIAEREENLYN